MVARLAWLEAVDLGSPEFREMLQLIAENEIPIDPTLMAHHTKHFGDAAEYQDDPDQALAPGISGTWHEFGVYVVDNWSEEDFARARRAWPTVLALVRAYHRAGILLTTGSDTPNPWVIPGKSLHQEMALLASAGISPSEVIGMATRNGAESLGLLDEIGTVEIGKRADLVVLSADPLKDIRNTRSVRYVVQSGQLLDPNAILAEPLITDW
jgi:imidazolonepropionase-like amidohydrolase